MMIVAHRTAATPKLLEAVRSRARKSPCSFTLVLPRPYWDPDTEETASTIELAVPLLEEAAGTRVEAVVGSSDPLDAIREALARERFDEVIVSTLPTRVSRWLHQDLPHRAEKLGLEVTLVTATEARRTLT